MELAGKLLTKDQCDNEHILLDTVQHFTGGAQTWDFIRTLLSKGVDVNQLHENNNESALQIIIMQQEGKVPDDIFEALITENTVNSRNRLGLAPIMYACYFSSFDHMLKLLDCGADRNGFDLSGVSPLDALVIRHW